MEPRQLYPVVTPYAALPSGPVMWPGYAVARPPPRKAVPWDSGESSAGKTAGSSTAPTSSNYAATTTTNTSVGPTANGKPIPWLWIGLGALALVVLLRRK